MNTNGANQLTMYLLRTAIGVVILTCAAWAGYVTNNISNLHGDVTELREIVATINGKLDIILSEVQHGRH